MPSAPPAPKPPPLRGAVFLSYASQDTEAARGIAEALQGAGIEVWFDRSELRGGDAWDQKIRKQIRDCTLFVPVVSASTQARREGYFRLEWKLADDRTHLMAKGTPFLVPVCIDDTKDWDALVPDSFMNVQWTRLPGGENAAAFAERVTQLLAGETTPPMAVRGPSRAPHPRHAQDTPAAVAPKRKSPRWALAIGACAAAGMVVGYFALRPKPSADSAVASAPAATRSAEFPRDADLRRARQLIYGVDAIADDLVLADDIAKGVLAQRPNDPEGLTVAAEIAVELRARGFDLTETRRAMAQRCAERAVQLASENPVALAVLGRYLMIINAQLPRAEELLRHAIRLDPADPRFYRSLYQVLVRTKPPAEVDAMVADMIARFPDDALVRYDIARMAKDANNAAEAERGFDEALARGPISTAMVWKAWLALEVHGDPAAMKTWLDRVPERQRSNTRYANALAVHATVTGDTAPAIKVLNDLPDLWLTDFDFTGPKALLIGDLLTIEGHPDLARLQYEAALALVQREKGRDGTDLRPLRAEAATLFGLGRVEEARALFRVLEQTALRPYRWTLNYTWWHGSLRLALLLGERTTALTMLRESCDNPQTRQIFRNLFRLDPLMAPFRGDPEIVACFAEPKKEVTAVPLTEGAQLAARALALITKVGFTRDDVIAAEDLAERATKREPDSAATWGVRAVVQSAWLFRNWDYSEKRRQDTQAFANRALVLDPKEPEALLAIGHVLRRQGAFAQAGAHLRSALAANPQHTRLARALAQTIVAFPGREAEARAVQLQMLKTGPDDPLLRYETAMSYAHYGRGGEVPENLTGAIEQLDAALAIQPFGSALLLKAVLLGGWRGDLPAMRATLDQMDKLPFAERSEDRSVSIAMWAGLMEHRPDRVEAAARLTARNYTDDVIMPMRPKAWSLALAHRMAGKDNSARADWQAAEAVLRQRMKDGIDDEILPMELATTLAWLDRREEAARLVAAVEPAWKESLNFHRSRALAMYYAAMGDAAKAAGYLPNLLDQTPFVTSKTIALDPWWDKIRGAPEFVKLAKGPAAKP